MKEEIKNIILHKMSSSLTNKELMKLKEVLDSTLKNFDVIKIDDSKEPSKINNCIEVFISSKKIEGCSEKTLKYYQSTISKCLDFIGKNSLSITTDDIRKYLSHLESFNKLNKVSLDNTRRILSSYFSWLEDEDYIIKSPIRRIHRIKSVITVKDTYSDEELEIMRDESKNLRDLALIDVLSSTGMRVGELVLLNINDINFEERECVVLGKGNKQRIVYFDARTKIHLKNYIDSRVDSNPALFVSLKKPYKRLKISSIETLLRKYGNNLGLSRVYPHKFRRTLATKAIDKGMPIEQLQTLLGHKKIDTTLQYAMVKQNNVKIAHRKYIG